ncbi:DUF6903 family protein [Viridibacillus arvi]|uniref:DUF6903 family protein n=1 Tax=Viridibacillus TaxID=496496 RepID=UPI00147021CD|nr:hypothetical protein [Viridibacillus arvi]
MKRNFLITLRIVIFITCLALIIVGQKTTGKFELGIMLVGLAGLLGLLYSYNRKFI